MKHYVIFLFFFCKTLQDNNKDFWLYCFIKIKCKQGCLATWWRLFEAVLLGWYKCLMLKCLEKQHFFFHCLLFGELLSGVVLMQSWNDFTYNLAKGERESQPSVSVDKVVHFAIEAGRRSMWICLRSPGHLQIWQNWNNPCYHFRLCWF